MRDLRPMHTATLNVLAVPALALALWAGAAAAQPRPIETVPGMPPVPDPPTSTARPPPAS